MAIQDTPQCPECKGPLGTTKEVEAKIATYKLGDKIPVWCWDCKISYWMVQKSKKPLEYAVIFRGKCR